MFRHALRVIAGLLSLGLLATCPARAVNIVDQNAPNATSFIAGFDKPDLAQSFRQSGGNISGAGVFLHPRVGTSGSVSISLWTNLPDETNARQLATGLIAAVAGQWADIFWTPVEIDPAKTYYLQFTGSSTLGIAGNSQAGFGYAYGLAFANAGYLPYINYDYAFRTYRFIPDPPPAETPQGGSEPPVALVTPPSGGQGSLALDNFSISAAPDAATWLTMLCGFGMAGSALRRRRRNGFRSCHA